MRCPKTGLGDYEFACIPCKFRRICSHQFKKFGGIRDTRRYIFPFGIKRVDVLPRMKIHQWEMLS